MEGSDGEGKIKNPKMLEKDYGREKGRSAGVFVVLKNESMTAIHMYNSLQHADHRERDGGHFASDIQDTTTARTLRWPYSFPPLTILIFFF